MKDYKRPVSISLTASELDMLHEVMDKAPYRSRGEALIDMTKRRLRQLDGQKRRAKKK